MARENSLCVHQQIERTAGDHDRLRERTDASDPRSIVSSVFVGVVQWDGGQSAPDVMLPMTLQFIVAMFAYAIKERMARRVDYWRSASLSISCSSPSSKGVLSILLSAPSSSMKPKGQR